MILNVAKPAYAQDTVETLLSQLRATQANETATPEQLQAATGVISKILGQFPASDAAASILLDEDFEGIDFSSFETRLANLSAAPATANPLLPTFLAEDAPGTAPAPAVNPLLPTFLTDGASAVAPDVTCIAEAYTPTAATQMRIQIVVEPGGVISGLPELVDPIAPTPEVRKDYFGLVTAAESCAPLSSWATAGGYVLSVSLAGDLSVQGVSADGTTPLANEAIQPPSDSPPLYQLPSDFGISSPATEAALALDRSAIRDVQARLLVSGHDPNGVDGVLGNGARAALSAWQTSTGKAATGYLNAPQLQHLQQLSEAQLALWLQDPDNAAIYDPPKVTPRKNRRTKRRVRVCNRNALGILYNCRNVYR